MNFRRFGKTNQNISEIGLGTWQVGGKWGSTFDHKLAENILNTAADNGINFIDSADVYSDGESERAIGNFLKTRSEKFFVATKCGRQINPHTNEGYTPAVLRKYVEDSLKRLQLETLDLVQLHCPPTQVFYRPEIFGLFEDLKTEGKVQNLGISVEKVEEALKGIEFNNVVSVQIIFNMFRQRPCELFFEQAKKKDVGVIVRVPLASGLLTGKYTKDTSFEAGDHRFFNRNGEMFDKGETFSGIDYNTGLEAVAVLKELFSGQLNLAEIALRWILMFENVSTVIPGASRPEQVVENLNCLQQPALSDLQMSQAKEIYLKYFKNTIHQWW
ncbi:aldo/keto reductase [Lacihabitans soyangensis]|uniref:Aldo/keto reductase n=1 Tax=Lacihabitans soyangensis TaxID=869394 RepID=A0AAE3H0Y4_9BACT|nr:aldo/keto reductase [Lacihabitans soyangensis]MCP9762016.1 aldo/keto reductase [Lacihabitans soyangensis]